LGTPTYAPTFHYGAFPCGKEEEDVLKGGNPGEGYKLAGLQRESQVSAFEERLFRVGKEQVAARRL